MQVTINQQQILITENALLDIEADAIVNDTDSGLTIPAWLADAAGDSVVHEANMIGWCDIGAAVVTSAGNLQMKYIIHTASPRWGDDSARGKLENATWAILQLAEDSGVTSVAIPPLSVGANGYPIENCAKVMLEQIIDFTFEPANYLQKIMLCVTPPHNIQIFYDELQRQIRDLHDADNNQIRVS